MIYPDRTDAFGFWEMAERLDDGGKSSNFPYKEHMLGL